MCTVAELREALAPARRDGSQIALVPTMGAFHEGHLSLMRAARAECDVVVVSLFVNPTQFGQGEDFDNYPRDLDGDVALAGRRGGPPVPSLQEVYPRLLDHGRGGGLDRHALRRSREPWRRTLPRRDDGRHQAAQHVPAGRRLFWCQGLPAGARRRTPRARPRLSGPDRGLPDRPRSRWSRSARATPTYLTSRRALSLKRALDTAEHAIRAGTTSVDEVAAAARNELEGAGVEAEYVELVSAGDLSPLEEIGEEDVLVAIAARIGNARLIDNVVVEPSAAVRRAV